MPRTADSVRNDRNAVRPLVEFLVSLRKTKGISRSVLAGRLGCRLNQLAGWEHVEQVPGVFWLSRWAAELGHDLALIPQE